jgi:hypothetical protein
MLAKDGCGTVHGLRFGGLGAVRRAARLKRALDHLGRRIFRPLLLSISCMKIDDTKQLFGRYSWSHSEL